MRETKFRGLRTDGQGLPLDVIEILIRAKSFVPLYMPTKEHHENNALALDIIEILKKYKAEK